MNIFVIEFETGELVSVLKFQDIQGFKEWCGVRVILAYRDCSNGFF